MPKTLLALLAPLLLAAQQERVDLNLVHRIKTEEFQHTAVMETVYNLTDRYGPRLTNSPQYRAAGEWSVKQLREWGINDARLEGWGPFGNGWDYTSFSAAMIEPAYQPLIAAPVAWSMSTNGPVTGTPELCPVEDQAGMDQCRGKLKGKIVLASRPRDLPFPVAPLGRRYTLAELNDLSTDDLAGSARALQAVPAAGPAGQPSMTPDQIRLFRDRLQTYFRDEQPAVVVRISPQGDSGTVFGGGADRERTDSSPQVMLSAEHYNRIARLLDHHVPVRLQFDLKARFYTDNLDSFNVIAEIPGNARKEEFVMLGAHLDSWHYGTGATDNAAGCAVSLEAVRILAALHLKMDRTVRMALWGGEEQGLLGSAAYVKAHFADPEVMKPATEHGRLSGYFNVDNGGGRIRGVYLQGNEMMRPIFEAWFAALKDLTPGVITIRDTSGTDHLSFDRVGLPGFQFVQDPMDYATRTHHSNMDVYDRIEAQDLMQAAVVEALFAYNAATRADMLPRKDLPEPRTAAGLNGRSR